MPVWVKSGPSLAKGSTETVASGEKGHLDKTMLFIKFSYCLGGLWQALGSSGVPVEASQEAMDPLVPAKGHKGSIGIYENGRKRTEMDANGCKRMETNPNSSRIRGQNLSKGQDI